MSEVETKCSALSVSPSLGTLPPSFRVEGEDDDQVSGLRHEIETRLGVFLSFPVAIETRLHHS